LQPKDWNSVRLQAMFDCCKWDIQSEDHSVLADFPLFLEKDEWASLAGLAEKLAEEVFTAERELFCKAKLHAKLGLPADVRSVLRKCHVKNSPAGSARLMRFDFHFTPEGWRISEVNADVPGGLIEASGFTELIAANYPGYSPGPNPVNAYAEAIAKAVGQGAVIGLVHATAHYDDRQVMQYLAQSLQRLDLQVVVLSPAHLTWESGFAHVASCFAKVKPALLVRFFPAEWLPNLRPSSSWTPWFCGGQTPMSNPASAILIQSKRFPLVWNELDMPLNAWRSLLPRTKCPSDVQPAFRADWVFKPVFGRVGEDVAIAGITEQRAHLEIVEAAQRQPSNWVAQRRFESVPVETDSGLRYACAGVFTLDGRAVGVYGRISTKPLIDQEAQDIAVLIRSERSST
jgi:glutathionylspermidine synthase